MTISSISVSVSGLTDGDHHGLTLLLEGNLDGLSGGLLILGLVAVAAHLVVDLLDALGTDGPGDGVALLNILDGLSGKFDGGTVSIDMRGTDISLLNNIKNTAVVLGVLITISWLMVGWLVIASISWGWSISWLMISSWLVISLSGNTSCQGRDKETQPGLMNTKISLIDRKYLIFKGETLVSEIWFIAAADVNLQIH